MMIEMSIYGKGAQLVWSKPILWLFPSVFFLATAFPLYAQDATTQSDGGPGGDPFTVGCGNDKLMVGVQIRTGDHIPLGLFINMVRPFCVAVDAGGDWLGTPTSTSSFAGHDNGNLDSVMCPRNEAVTGFGGYAGVYVDGISIYCSSGSEYGRVSNDQHFVDKLVGFRDFEGPKGPFSCPSNKPAKGITGRAHDWLDRLALVCNFPTTPPANVDDISFPDTVIGGNPVAGFVTLNATAPAGGVQVAISRQTDVADSGFFPVNAVSPDPLIVPSGNNRVSFVFNTLSVPRVVNVKLNPGPGSATHFVSKNLRVLPPSLTSVALSQSLTAPGGSVTGTVALNGNAPPGGLTANLTSSVSAVATVPPSVSLAAGASSAAFPITVASTNKSGCTVISASGLFAPQGSSQIRQALLSVKGPFSPAFKLGLTNNLGSSAIGSVLLDDVIKVAETFTLQSNNPSLLNVPASISVPANSQSANFTITVQGLPPSGISCAVVSVTDPKGSQNSMVFLISNGLKRIE